MTRARAMTDTGFDYAYVQKQDRQIQCHTVLYCTGRVHVTICAYVYIYIYIHVYSVCVYMYIYIYTYTYVCVCVYGAVLFAWLQPNVEASSCDEPFLCLAVMSCKWQIYMCTSVCVPRFVPRIFSSEFM